MLKKSGSFFLALCWGQSSQVKGVRRMVAFHAAILLTPFQIELLFVVVMASMSFRMFAMLKLEYVVLNFTADFGVSPDDIR